MQAFLPALAFLCTNTTLIFLSPLWRGTIISRTLHLRENWRQHFTRSYSELLHLILVTFCYYKEHGDILNSICAGFGSSQVVIIAAEVLSPLAIRINDGKLQRFNNTTMHVILLSYFTYHLFELIFANITMMWALVFASVSSVNVVLVGDFMQRWEPLKDLGQTIANRAHNLFSNWRNHTLRSFFEASVWMGTMMATFTLTGRFIHSVQVGSFAGIVAILTSYLMEAWEVNEPQPRVSWDVVPKVPKDAKKMYTMEEVRKHNKDGDLWLVYQDMVLDASKFAPRHPGGENLIQRFGGRDATDELRNFHGDKALINYLPGMCVGHVTDPPKPSKTQLAFRDLYEQFQAKGWFVPKLEFYVAKCAILAAQLITVFVLVCFTDNDYLHLLAALILAVYFWQIAFVGHDAGHMSVSTDRYLDCMFGLAVGNLLSGVSIGWWKATHNTHHGLPNSLHHDPDIAHMPIFAVTDAFFNSPFNTYHNRVMPFDWLARNVFVPYQHYWYYPIMGFARVNLYLQSVIRILKEKRVEFFLMEVATMLGFFAWYAYLLSQLNSSGMRWAFFLVSHVISGILEVQITLSHFSREVFMDPDDFGGDFYSRNIISSLDVTCPKSLDWVHGGLQFQTIHHCFPRMCRRNLRAAVPYIQKVCLENNLPYSSVSFWEANVQVFTTLKETATKSRTWSPLIAESFNAQG